MSAPLRDPICARCGGGHDLGASLLGVMCRPCYDAVVDGLAGAIDDLAAGPCGGCGKDMGGVSRVPHLAPCGLPCIVGGVQTTEAWHEPEDCRRCRAPS